MNDKEILKNLLEYESKYFGSKLGLILGKQESLDEQLLRNALSILSKISRSETSDQSKQLAITITAIIWTHCDPELHDSLRQFLTPVLSAIGFSPSNNMIDPLLKKEGAYSYHGSYFDKLKIALNDFKNQITIGNEIYTLTSFQHGIWKSLDVNKVIGISAPTSAGKSFIIYLKIVQMILNGATRIVYVVPTLSLISQVTSDLSLLLKKHGIPRMSVLNSFDKNLDSFIYVLTQERTITVFSDEEIEHLDLLVVDEIQNIEKLDDDKDERSKILYDVLMDLRFGVNVNKIILSGPRLRKIGNLAFELFGEATDEKTTESPPVLNITYSISKDKKDYYLNQYTNLLTHPIRVKIDNKEKIAGFGQVQYTDKFNSYINDIINNLKDDVNIIFSPTANQARQSAKELSRIIPLKGSKELTELSVYFRESVHLHYELAEYVNYGIAYHTGKIPLHVRKSLEYAASNQLISNLFCTTTLMQGVNLPAKNIIIRNPNLYTKSRGENIKLSPYEFANLRGRAGRLLIDFIGRTIVLDESAFEDSKNSEESVFSGDYKEIKTGYDEIYERDSDFINEALVNPYQYENERSKSIITYIRHTLYKYGKDGSKRLENVGITLDDLTINETLKELEKVTVDRDVVLGNRYWDPMDLNLIYGLFKRSNKNLPNTLFKKDLYEVLLYWLETMRDNFPYYYDKYIGKSVYDDGYLYGIAKSAESWAREKPLVNILTDRFPMVDEDLQDKLDKEIEKLTKYVSYGLPMLLKPIADFSGASGIISQIELGMFNESTKYLSDRGVPRETAIKITILLGIKTAEELNLPLAYTMLNSWEKQHISHLI